MDTSQEYVKMCEKAIVKAYRKIWEELSDDIGLDLSVDWQYKNGRVYKKSKDIENCGGKVK